MFMFAQKVGSGKQRRTQGGGTTEYYYIILSLILDKLKDNSALYLLQNKDQVLPASVEEEINFVPHYNTLIESGTNEYFTEGQKFLPCALAELVDNALSATAKNTDVRKIEIRLLFDRTSGKPAIVVLDNGCGMTSKQLNNWAVYRLSKFTRENSTFQSEREGYVHPDPVPRSLNSDISYFGVGGKRAVFHMGNSVRMISKPIGTPDVHELVLSKEEFQKKEQNKEDVYKGTILNRTPGDSSHITDDERFLRSIITEENGKNSFTVVVVTGISQEHIAYLKEEFDEWTRELAHIYHYYIHGVNGNCKTDISRRSDNLPRIDIIVSLITVIPVWDLRDVQDDMQTLFINAAKDTFEFRAETTDNAVVEGVLRYHPFLYDRETYPKDPKDVQDDDNDETEPGALGQARGRRDIFECFWNGRLIPYTTISGFDWCQKKGSKLPAECFNRFSGVLFTDGKFLVNANKLKFMKLEKQLTKQATFFPQGKRGNIQKAFNQWLQDCHEKFDKQVEFIGYRETVTRPEVETKKKQHPWAVFSSIQLDGKRYDAGQILKSQKTSPILYGTVVNFFLYGDHEGDVFATGGEVKIKRLVFSPENLSRLGKYTLTLNAVVNENGATVFGGRELPSYEHKFTIKEGNAESFTITELSPSQHVGVPFNIPLQIEDRYGHPTKPPPKLQPVLKCRSVVKQYLQYFMFICTFCIYSFLFSHFVVLLDYDLNVTLPGLKNDTQVVRISLYPGKPHSLHVKSKTNPVENGNPVSFDIEVHDEAGNITANPKQKVHCQVCKQVAAVTTELMVMPSSRISWMELFCQGKEKLEFRNNETIKRKAGEVLKNLFYKLYDEAGREVPITAEIASDVQVTWRKNIDQRDFPKGRLPDLQVPTHVDEEHFYQVSYLDKNVSSCFKIISHSIEVTGVRFHSGSLGSREICFSYKDFTESVILKVTPGVPSQLKLVSGPEQVKKKKNYIYPDLWVWTDAGVQLFLLSFSFRGHHTLQFKGSLNDKYIPGPSVNLTLLPDPNKPVRLSVDYDTSARFPAGGTFPVFSVTVFSDEGSPMKTFKPADLSMLLWEGVSSVRPEITVLVVANEPVKLEPDCQPPTPVVFYCTDITNRLLVENMTLKITDQFGNLAGQGLNGKVSISIKCPEGERNRSLPLFEGKTSTLHISLNEGSAHMNVSNIPYVNGSRYILLFRPEVTVPPTSLTPFELPFHFYNDAENQQKMSELMSKKDQLTDAAKGCEKLIDSIRKEKDVGHLAFVADDDAARVISWQLQGDMDCVITTTTEAAHNIYKDSGGNQQVMALDSIHKCQKSLPMPHIKNGHELFKPPGNPTFARDLLTYPHKQQMFKTFLRDTILMDDLRSATSYRRENGIYCPTILTRQGDRLSARGKFGGAQNRAPSIDKLKVFGAPLPERYYLLKEQIGDSSFRLLLKRFYFPYKQKVEKDHKEHSVKWVNELLQNETKKNGFTKELQDIDRQLGTFSPFIYLFYFRFIGL
uniref:Structural maintenance of chromosomes flexible hinge domain containing 1 n=1 Tax=Fundulus heteroclitus TaxID=8078 RepID=A0A3Q2T7I8_FUNHE